VTRPPRPSIPTAGDEAGRPPRYALADAAVRPDHDPDPALDSAGRTAAAAGGSVDRGGGGPSRRLPLPRRRAHRPAAEPARARARTSLHSAWHRGRDRLPRVRGCRGTRHPRAGDRRREADTFGLTQGRSLLYGRVRTPPANRRGAGPRPLPALAQHAPPSADQGPEAGPGLPQQHRDARRREVHDEGAELGGERRRRDGSAAVQQRARPGGLDLHAARHAAVDRGGRPPLPAAARLTGPDPADGVRGRPLRARADAAVAHHRRERGSRAVAPRDHGGRPGHRQLRADHGRLGRDRGADPVRRSLARGDPGSVLRTRAAPDLRALGHAPVPRHPSARGARRGAERARQRAQAAPAARHLRPARRRRDLRARRHPRRPAAPRGGPRGVGVLLGTDRVRAVGRGDPGRPGREWAGGGAACPRQRTSGGGVGGTGRFP
jgi:hypothetical protein